eukprot:TRINITY_DN8010_c0_g1_i5.p2 TRINITY_DN8010_c0_g1~~TRINITY_DN8010_c0_g1_i5.p2  ORF type:complete len:131 (-),score=27.27 TRINITY_DN8010_c0_g1_i5:10-402(-)
MGPRMAESIAGTTYRRPTLGQGWPALTGVGMDELLNVGNGLPPSAKGAPAVLPEDMIRQPEDGVGITSTAFLFACIGLLLFLGVVTELWLSNAKLALSLSLSSAIGLVMVKIGRAVQQECRDRSRMPSSA